MTPYEKVFKAFLNKISDPLYASLEEHLLSEDLLALMDSAIVNFEYPRINLKEKDDTSEEFANDLGLDEIQILSHLMVLEWMSRILRDVDSLRDNMTTQDFRTFSKGNHINALIKAEERQRAKVNELKINYSLRDSNNRSKLSVLGGANN